MTVVLLLHPKINYMTIPTVMPVNSFRTIPLCGNHSSHWFKLNDFFIARVKLPRGRRQVNNGRGEQVCFARRR
jgi:hypothetical protein